jgi:DNA repair ATPase RecN
MLRSLELTNLGPVDRMAFVPGKRLNVIAGDSGLGKSFLLDVAWWAVTRT